MLQIAFFFFCDDGQMKSIGGAGSDDSSARGHATTNASCRSYFLVHAETK